MAICFRTRIAKNSSHEYILLFFYIQRLYHLKEILSLNSLPFDLLQLAFEDLTFFDVYQGLQGQIYIQETKRGVNHSLEIFGNPYKKLEISYA
jgi:hypothetical protein